MKWCIKAGPGYNVIGKWKAYKTVLPKPVTRGVLVTRRDMQK